MGISTQIARIQAGRDTIRAKLVELGIATSVDNLDRLATLIEGIANVGAVKIEVKEGETYTIPAGYHNGTGTVAGVAGGGNYALQLKEVIPTKNQQSITSDDGYYGLSGVTVAPIPDAFQNVSSVTAEAGNVLVGKIFVAADGTVVTGTMTNNGSVDKTLDVTSITFTIPKGYHDGTGKVEIVLETKTVIPTETAQDITPTAGKVLSKVTVKPIPARYADTTPATADASSILEGESAALPVKDTDGNVTGSKIVEGTMPNNGAVSKTLNAGTTSYSIPEGYHSGFGKVSIEVERKTTTPTKSQQSITPSNGKLLVGVTVDPIPDNYITTDDADAVASEIIAGKYAYVDGTKVKGTMPDIGEFTSYLSTGATYCTIPKGYHNGDGQVTITLEEKSVTLTREAQTITPTGSKVLSKVTVPAIPDSLQDVTPVTAEAAHVLASKKIVSSTGAVVDGAMANNGAVKTSIDGLSKTSYTIPAGYHSGSGTVSLTGDIEEALAAI